MPHSTDNQPAPRLTGIQRRTSIVAAARTEFAQHGYHGTSTASIAKQANCSEPMLYKHFSGKHDLFIASLHDSIRLYQNWFMEQVGTISDVDAIDLVRKVIHEQMHQQAFHELMRLRMLAVSLSDDIEVRDTLNALDQDTAEYITVLLNHAVAQGRAHHDVDPAYVVWSWFGLMLAASYREVLQPGSFSQMTSVVDGFLDSIAPSD